MKTRSNAQRFFDRWVLATFGGWSFGCAQWWVARKWFGTSSKWMWASVVGVGTRSVLSGLVGAWGHAPEFLIGPNAAVGGLLVGLCQRRMLRFHSARANGWVPACIAGWMLAAALPPALIGSRSGPHWSNLVVIALGGVVLRVVTGGALVWVLRSFALTGQEPGAAEPGGEVGPKVSPTLAKRPAQGEAAFAFFGSSR